jgi:hypothetical protein
MFAIAKATAFEESVQGSRLAIAGKQRFITLPPGRASQGAKSETESQV